MALIRALSGSSGGGGTPTFEEKSITNGSLQTVQVKTGVVAIESTYATGNQAVIEAIIYVINGQVAHQKSLPSPYMTTCSYDTSTNTASMQVSLGSVDTQKLLTYIIE